MVFSLFGKKDDSPSKKPEPKKPASGPVAKSQAQPDKRALPNASALDQDADLSLDFTSFVALPMGAAGLVTAASGLSAPAVSPLAAVPAMAKALKSAARLAPTPPPPLSPRPQRKPPPPDSVMSIEVTSSPDALAVVEEAAILFANAQDQSALAVLLQAVNEDDAGKVARQVWLMLFDMYQHLGMKKEHEERALAFAAKFERSPPTWIEQQAKTIAATPSAVGCGFVEFGDVLDARITTQIDQMRQIAGKSPAVRLDLAKLAAVDATGCRILLQCLQQLRRGGTSVALSAEGRFIALLAAQATLGDGSTDQAVWLLSLEVYQMLGLQDAYEEAALNFAITYELSPPAWEPAAVVPQTLQSPAGASPAPLSEQLMCLSGEITGTDCGTLKAVVDYAAGCNPVVIDFSAVARVDFANAGQLLNTFSKLHQAGKAVKIRGANELILALFGVMGVQAVTGIETKS